jgi:hypothetical protein
MTTLTNKDAHRGTVPAPGSAANDPALLTRKQLAKKISLSTRSVDTLQKRKAIPFIRLSARCVRFEIDRVLAALRRFELKEID